MSKSSKKNSAVRRREEKKKRKLANYIKAQPKPKTGAVKAATVGSVSVKTFNKGRAAWCYKQKLLKKGVVV